MRRPHRGLVLPAFAACLFAGCAAAPPQSAAIPGDDVFAGGRVAARYVHEPYDPARHTETCKVYHHVFAPDGRLLTKGLGGEFEHHRGLFLGFNQVTCGALHLDFWHCHHGETQRHEGFARPDDLGLVGDWQVARIAWCDASGRAIVRELRALRARPLDAGTTVLDVVVELRAVDAAVQLAGDPQHSGHQFRALDAFSPPDAEKVAYLRPPGAAAHGDDVWTGCTWIAAILPLADGPVTVVRTETAGNPTPVRWSTRPYGRFGATFAHTLLPGQPLRLGYRYALALGALDQAQCAALGEQAQAVLTGHPVAQAPSDPRCPPGSAAATGPATSLGAVLGSAAHVGMSDGPWNLRAARGNRRVDQRSAASSAAATSRAIRS